MENKQPHHSSSLVVKIKDEASFRKYVCHFRDKFQSTNHKISEQKKTSAGKNTRVQKDQSGLNGFM